MTPSRRAVPPHRSAVVALVAMFILLLSVPAVDAAPAGPTAPAAPPVDIVRNLEIPTRSGHVLRADLYRPVVDGRPATGLPTIVTYFPYVKDDTTRFEVEAMHQFAQRGYAGLLIDLPGTGASLGTFGFLDTREIADGRDAVDWAAAQDFSNGRTALWGYSYPGLTAAHIAATHPPSLKAVVPASIFNDPYRDLVRPGGILTTQDAALLPFLAAFNVARPRPGTDPQILFEELLDSVVTPNGLATLAEAGTHEFYDDYWKERALENKIANIKAPALLWGSWSDIYPRGTLLNQQAIGSEYVRLVMGPWGHLSGAMEQPLQLFLDESLAWFDTFLRQDATPVEAEAIAGGARIFDIDWDGSDVYAGVWPGRFQDFETWPPSDSQDTVFALCADTTSAPSLEAPWVFQGTLGTDCTTDASLPVLPLPVDATGGGSIGHDLFANPFGNDIWDDKDQRLSTGSTGFLTEPLDTASTITGAMELQLSADTLGVNADWVVRVIDVGPDRTRVIAPGWLRASRRATDPARPVLWHRHDADLPITPGEPYDMTIEIWPSSYRIPAGHRVGILLRTADTLKVAPGVGQLVSNVRVGPTATSSLRIPMRADPTAADPAPTNQSSSPALQPQPNTVANGQAPPASPATLPATGQDTILFVPLILGALALLVRGSIRRGW